MSESVFILRRGEVSRKIGLSRSAIYDRLNPDSPRYDPSFPKPIKLGNTQTIGFIESEVDGWLAAQIERARGVMQ